jgi:hypothetical protein
VEPLEHVVHPEGHITQEKQPEVSGTLGARGNFSRVKFCLALRKRLYKNKNKDIN